MKKLRILLAIGSSEIGGGQKVFLSYIREISKKDYSVVVVLPDGPLVGLIKAFNIKIHIVNFNSIISLITIAKILKKERVDIINTYLTKCSLLFSLVNIYFRVPLCCTLLNAITHEKLSRLQRIVYPFFYLLLQKMCDGIIVNSLQNKKHLIDVAGMSQDSVKVIYSGIDIENFVSSQAQIKRNKIEDRVMFMGFQSGVAPFMQQMDVVIVPSLNETFGITIVEAFALKKIVIASDVGGIPELVKHKITGLLFPVKDSATLAKTIEYTYNNKAETKELSNNAYRFAMENFTSATMADNTLLYYDYIRSQTHSSHQSANKNKVQ